VPTELQAQVQAAQALAEAKGKGGASGSQGGRLKPIEEKPNSLLLEKHSGIRAREGDPIPQQRPDRASRRGAKQRKELGLILAKRGYMDGDGCKAKLDTGQGQGKPPKQSAGKDMFARESQVALWLGNIKPRVPAKAMVS